MARFGEIGKQYFDDAGDPLISGKLFFFESGTTTDKDTFADVNLSITNTNPVLLTASGRQPNVFFDGSARVVLTDANDVQIEVRDPEGGDVGGQFGDWSSLTIYGEADIVTGSDGRYYRSIGDGNLGNDPTASSEFWEEVQFLGVWNSVVTYPANATVKGSDGLLYRSLIADNLNNDPTSSPTEWAASVESGQIVGIQTISVPAAAMTARTTDGAGAGSVELVTNQVMVTSFDFDPATDEFVQVPVRMPKGWNAGTITAQFIWSHDVTTVNFGVAWAIQAVSLADDDAQDTAFGTAIVTTDIGGVTDDLYVSAVSAAVTIANTPAKSDWVIFQIFRDVSDGGDTLVIDARLQGVALLYTTDAAVDD